MGERDIVSINVSGRVAIFDDGYVGNITHFFDEDGDECESGDAVSAVATDGAMWYVFDLRDFETVSAN